MSPPSSWFVPVSYEAARDEDRETKDGASDEVAAEEGQDIIFLLVFLFPYAILSMQTFVQIMGE